MTISDEEPHKKIAGEQKKIALSQKKFSFELKMTLHE
jgi:hypothetical protein